MLCAATKHLVPFLLNPSAARAALQVNPSAKVQIKLQPVNSFTQAAAPQALSRAAAAQHDQSATSKPVSMRLPANSALHQQMNASHGTVHMHECSKTADLAPVDEEQLTRHQAASIHAQVAGAAALTTTQSFAVQASRTVLSDAKQPPIVSLQSNMSANQQADRQQVPSADQQQTPSADQRQVPSTDQQHRLSAQQHLRPADQRLMPSAGVQQARLADQQLPPNVDQQHMPSAGEQPARSAGQLQAASAGQQQLSTSMSLNTPRQPDQQAAMHQQPLPERVHKPTSSSSAQASPSAVLAVSQAAAQQQAAAAFAAVQAQHLQQSGDEDMSTTASSGALPAAMETPTSDSFQAVPVSIDTLLHATPPYMPPHDSGFDHQRQSQPPSRGIPAYLDPAFASGNDIEADAASLGVASQQDRQASDPATALVLNKADVLTDRIAPQLQHNINNEPAVEWPQHPMTDKSMDSDEGNSDQQSSVMPPADGVRIVQGDNALKQVAAVSRFHDIYNIAPVNADTHVSASQSKSSKSAKFSWQKFGRSWVPRKQLRQL